MNTPTHTNEGSAANAPDTSKMVVVAVTVILILAIGSKWPKVAVGILGLSMLALLINKQRHLTYLIYGR